MIVEFKNIQQARDYLLFRGFVVTRGMVYYTPNMSKSACIMVDSKGIYIHVAK